MPSPFLAYLKESVSTFNDYVIRSKHSDASYVTGWNRDPILSVAQQTKASAFSAYVKGLDSTELDETENEVSVLDAEIYKRIKKKIKEFRVALKQDIDAHNTREQEKSFLTRSIKTSTGLTDLFDLFEKCLDYTFDIFKRYRVIDQPTEPSPLIQFKYALLRYWANKKSDQLMLTEYSSSLKDYLHGFFYDWKLSATKDTEVAKYMEKTKDTWEEIETYTDALLQIDTDIRDLSKMEGSVPVAAGGITGYIPVTISKNPASLTKELKALRRQIKRTKNPESSSARSSTYTTSPVVHTRESYHQNSRSAPSAPQRPSATPTPSLHSLPERSNYIRSAVHSPPPIKEEEEEDTVVYYSDDEAGASSSRRAKQ